MRRIPGTLLLIVILLTSACSTTTRRVQDPLENEYYASRASELSALGSWHLDARLAVSTDEDGGSGKLRWDHGPNSDSLDFHGALGRLLRQDLLEFHTGLLEHLRDDRSRHETMQRLLDAAVGVLHEVGEALDQRDRRRGRCIDLECARCSWLSVF